MTRLDWTLVGLGLTAAIAKGKLLNATRGWLNERVLGIPVNSEWCLYCVGFWVGFSFSMLGHSRLANAGLDALYLTGVCWLLSETLTFLDSIWYAIVESHDGPIRESGSAQVQSDAGTGSQSQGKSRDTSQSNATDTQ